MPPTLTEQASGDQTSQIADLLLDEEPKAEEPSEVVEEVDETEEVSAEKEVDESESEPQKEESVEDESNEEITWGSVLGVDDSKIVLDDNEQLTGVKVKVDGEESTVKMDDLIAGYQNNKFNTKKSQALAEQRKEFETSVQKTVEDYKAKVEAVDKLSQYLKKQFTQEFESIDWQKLRVENPAEYAAASQDYNMRQSQIDRIMNAIGSEKQELSEEDTKKAQEKQKAFIDEQASALVSAFPEWQDQKVASAAFTEMGEFASETYGVSPQEFSETVDARLIRMMHDAMQYHKGKSLVQSKVKKPVPKFQKSTGRTTRKVSKLDKLTKRAKSSSGANKRRAEVDAITELLVSGDK